MLSNPLYGQMTQNSIGSDGSELDHNMRDVLVLLRYSLVARSHLEYDSSL